MFYNRKRGSGHLKSHEKTLQNRCKIYARKSHAKSIGKLSKLKVLSLRNNRISAASGKGKQQQQPLPKELWVNTLLIDLNLHGNPLTSTQLNTMEGYDVFLSRRRDVKNKDILGGAMTDLEGCGLK